MPTQKPTGARTQAERFAETARALGADEDEATFRAKLAVIARQKPKDDAPPAPEPAKPIRKPKAG